MKPSWVVSLVLMSALAIAETTAQSGWSPVATGTPGNLRALFCISQSTAYACGSGGIIVKTTTGGDDWSTSVVDSSSYFSDILFTRGGTGYVSGSNSRTLKAELYRTTNSGSTWGLLKTGESNTSYITLCFTDSSTGYIGMNVGTNGNILKTTDAGQTWSPYSATAYVRSIHFGNATTGLAVGQGGVIYKTTNAGSSWVWKYQLPDAPLYDFYSVCIADSAAAFAAGDHGYLYKSTDAGETWTAVYNNPSFTRRLTSLWFTSTTTGFVVGDSGTIMKTTNRGVSWEPQQSTTNEYLSSVCFVDQSVGFVAGNHGLVLKTTNGGAAGIDPMHPEIPSACRLEQNYPNPFNPSTTIRFSIVDPQFTTVKVYDVLGREVSVLVSDRRDAGVHEVAFDGSDFVSGVYLYRLRAGGYVTTKRMLLLK